MFMVLTYDTGDFESLLVYLMNAKQRQAAADYQTKPTDLGSEFACRLLLSTSAITNFIITQPESCTVDNLNFLRFIVLKLGLPWGQTDAYRHGAVHLMPLKSAIHYEQINSQYVDGRHSTLIFTDS